MSLPAPPITEDSYILADWLEYEALSNLHGQVYVLNHLKNLTDIAESPRSIRGALASYYSVDELANYDEAGQEDLYKEIISEKVQNEILLRQEKLQKAYPFRLSDDGSTLTLKTLNEWGVGGAVYLYCLIIDYGTDEYVPEAYSAKPLTNNDRIIMQISSVLSAAGVCEGSSISFGFPRPDKSDFFTKLHQIYPRLFMEGLPKDTPPPGVSTDPKDEGIDIISWKPSNDGRTPHQMYLLGQVASGRDWEDKSIVHLQNAFHDTWFKDIPSTPRSATTFIPFCMHKDVLSVKSRRHGQIQYRYRLPYYAHIGANLVSRNDIIIEELERMYMIKQWVNNFRIKLLNVAA